jgi:putative spermidine/putrescine transport system ATP-binding protein
MAELEIRDLVKTYGDHRAVDTVNLKAEAAELVALLGPSGCGKTTLLRSIAGFVPISSGSIEIDGRDVSKLAPNKRNTGMVFQNYALFPHMSVAENVAFGLAMRKVPKPEIEERVAHALDLVSLTEYAERRPRALSGGQQQRVAVARALVVNPDVFLLDEPLSNLDAKLRMSVGMQLRALQQKLGLTTVFVTHDQKEALMMADRLVIMRAGRVVQEGSAEHLYQEPATRFVADFLGHSNVLTGSPVEGGFRTDGGLMLPSSAANGPRVLAVRPENLLLGGEAEGVETVLEANIEAVTYLGAITEATLTLPGGERVVAHHQNRTGSGLRLTVGDTIRVGWRTDATQLLIDDMSDAA